MKALTRNVAIAMLFTAVDVAAAFYLVTLGVDAPDIGNLIGEFVGTSDSRSVRRA